MKLHALTVGRNEEDRYLASMLEHAQEWADEHFFYDDQSTDKTLQLALDAGCYTCYRTEDPAFIVHEGRFRQNAWKAFEDCLLPKTGDWVLSIDADEVLVSTGTNCCLRCEVDQAIQSAEAQGAKSVLLPVPEVFGFDDNGTPLVRTDGYWGSIRGTRLFRYELGGVFRDKPMGCGSEPTYVAEGRISQHALGLHLMHFGYADPADQVAKHERYTALFDHGHNDKHIQSIVGPKTLEPWAGPAPEMKKGSHVDRAA